jgi:DHA1 family bicyclomycin/chloramphenicol resistance-like MFS transporter
MRVVQGLGASAGMTLTRAMVRDMYTGPEAAKLMSLMLLVFGVSPLFAPLLGGLILTLGGWRLIFWVLTGLVLAGLLLAAVLLRETHPHHKRIRLSPTGSAQLFGRLLKDRRFMGLTLSSGSWSGATFTFLATSSFVFTGEYHLSPMAYGVLFGLCATGMIATAQLNATVMRKIGAELQIRLTSATAVGVAVVMLGLVLTNHAPLWVMGLGTFLLFCCQGLNITPTTVTALDSQGANAGSAASLMGTLQMTFGATASGLVSNLFAPHAATLVGAQLSCLVIGAIACRVAFWRTPSR